MPTEEIAYQITIRGGEEAARVIEAIERAMAKQTAELQKANAAQQISESVTQRSAAGARSANIQFNTFGSTIGMIGQSVGRMNPALGTMVSTIAQSTGVVQTLTSAGLGPFGIAVGATTAAVGLLTAAIDAFDTEQAEADANLRSRSIPALEEYISKVNSAREADALRSRVRYGQGSEQEQSGALDRMADRRRAITTSIYELEQQINETQLGVALPGQREQLRILQGQLAAQREDLRNQEQVNRAAAQRRSIESEVSQSIARRAAAIEAEAAQMSRFQALLEKQKEEVARRDSAAQRTSRGGPSRSDREYERQAALVAQLTALENKRREEESAAQDRMNAARQAQLDITRKIQELESNRLSLLQQMRQKDDEILQGRLQQEREWRNSLGKGSQGESKDGKRVADLTAQYKELGTTAASSLEASIAAGGSAGAVMQNFFKDMAGSLAKMEIAKAISETAEGLGALASVYLSGTAPAHFAAAAQHAAAATAFGLLGAAIPAAPTGGGSAAPSVGETRPQRNSSGSRDSESTTVVVNFGGAVVTAATQAELGRQITRAVNAGSSRLGRS